MAVAYIDLGIAGEICLLQLTNGIPSGIQTAQGLSVFSPIGQIPGITDGSAAAAGTVGQLLQAVTASPVAFAATGTHNLISLTLPAGDWDVWGSMVLTSTGGSAVPAQATVGISTTTGVLPAAYLCASDVYGIALATPVSDVPAPQPFNVSTPTTVYLVLNVTVTSGTDLTALGILYARRSR
jgi:hypothetical protein